MLDKTFDHAAVEQALYDGWEGQGAFAAGGRGKPFAIVIPPPNITGSLHMGHALDTVLQDTLIRWRRMTGRDTLWQPGTDHAGIATQMVVERDLAVEQSSRQKIGREAFIARVWQWKRESGGTITRQLRRLGASLDWPRERFTMDEGLSAAVRRVFVQLHREGLIYRDRRLVNWDPKLQTAISDLEVESREVRGNLWHITYPIEGADRTLTVATTRPETMLADTAVAVHPDDDRYRDLVGRYVVLPLTGRRIPVIVDAYSDPAKGTGAVKITPAHDFNDFDVGQRHGLAMPSMLDREARISLSEITLSEVPGLADPAFVRGLEGLSREAARAAIVDKLQHLEKLERIEPHTHQVPHGDRSGVVIEPLLTLQWYCDAQKLAGPAIDAVETGRIAFVPRQWENTFFAWMRDIKPWCISRQLWWGHRIPAWYAPDGHVFVAETAEAAHAQADAALGPGTALAQDEDVLDTWFSSGLWPFSTLGWPERTAELARYYPTDVLVTGFDIIFFWVARMMMLGLHLTGDVPFRQVVIHGLVRDERGQKMSKSKGNGVDPLALIDEYGADALRLAICQLAGPGRDLKLGAARVAEARSFVTKLWNAARFCEMNGVAPDPGFETAAVQSPLCRWLLHAAGAAIGEATAALEAFRFDEYAQACYRFTWGVFCDWFVELSKPLLTGSDSPEKREVRATAAHVLGIILRMLHPACPFATEALWDAFGYGPRLSLIRAPWPAPDQVADADAARAEIEWVIGFITAIRTVRAEMNVPPATRAAVLLRDAAPATLARARAWLEPAGRLARVSDIGVTDTLPPGAAQLVLGEATLIIPLAGLVNLPAERARLASTRARAEDERARVAAKLAQADFVARAKPEVVEENRDRLRRAEGEVARLDAALARTR